MSNVKENRFKILLLSTNYIECKRSLMEADMNIIALSPEVYQTKRRIVTHIENVAQCLDEKDRLIIENELIKGKRGKWYLEYLSAPSYYRYRCRAYEEFLRSL